MRSAPDTPGTTNVWFEFVLASDSNPKQDGERRGYVSLANLRSLHKLSGRSREFVGGSPVGSRVKSSLEAAE